MSDDQREEKIINEEYKIWYVVCECVCVRTTTSPLLNTQEEEYSIFV